jgi:hypothetical protein
MLRVYQLSIAQCYCEYQDNIPLPNENTQLSTDTRTNCRGKTTLTAKIVELYDAQ